MLLTSSDAIEEGEEGEQGEEGEEGEEEDDTSSMPLAKFNTLICDIDSVVCMYACMYVCMYIRTSLHACCCVCISGERERLASLSNCRCILKVCVFMYVCMCVYE